MKIGYVKIHRKLVEWGWYRNDAVKSIFIHIMLKANYKDVPWEGIIVKKGQMITSYAKLAEETGHTVQKVRTVLNKLKSTGEITIRTTSKYTLITIEKWEEYQSFDEEATSKSTQSLTNNQQTNNNQLTNNQQQVKNIKNNKNINNNICAPARKNKFYNFEQKPIDYEKVRQKNLQRLMEKWG